MVNPKISILLPSAHRPEKLARCLKALYASEKPCRFELLICLMPGDNASREIVGQYPVDALYIRQGNDPTSSVWAWNKLADMALGEWLVLFADDLIADPLWLVEAIKAIDTLGGPGLVGLNDTHGNGVDFAAHYLVHREILDQHCGGWFIYPLYQSWWFDYEMHDIADRIGRYVWQSTAIVEHHHYDWSPEEMDDTYRRALPLHDIDKELYLARKVTGFIPYREEVAA
jgi:glycosyltransferase involved in cell wall biosynthesis